MVVQDIQVEPQWEGYHPLKLTTSRGDVNCRYYPVTGAQKGAIWVGGVGGDWDTPAQGLYPRLCHELRGYAKDALASHEAIASLRIRYRHPTELEESILDVLAGLSYLESEGIKAVALIGHSFGGAVVIQAAANSPIVRTVVTLATQSYGAATASKLAPRCSLLLIHGTADEILPPSCSKYVYQLAKKPKLLILYPNARHGLDEVSQEVHACVRDWVIEKLNID